MRFCLAALFLLCAFTLPTHAEDEVLPLKLDRTFKNLPASGEETPIFISAQHLQGAAENQVEASGVSRWHLRSRFQDIA